jgi:hypothetical protein
MMKKIIPAAPATETGRTFRGAGTIPRGEFFREMNGFSEKSLE